MEQAFQLAIEGAAELCHIFTALAACFAQVEVYIDVAVWSRLISFSMVAVLVGESLFLQP